MAEFTPITTQAEFDAAIADRLSRQEKTITARYEGAMQSADVEKLKTGYENTIADLKKQIEEAGTKAAESTKQLTELNAKIKSYESDSAKTRIALETGLPFQMAGRLTGETEEEIRKDAEALKSMIGGQMPIAPLAKEPIPPADPNKAALMELAKQLGNQ